jgi:hypothetical protein
VLHGAAERPGGRPRRVDGDWSRALAVDRREKADTRVGNGRDVIGGALVPVVVWECGVELFTEVMQLLGRAARTLLVR